MDIKKLNEAALESSRKILTDHFDWEAFLVYSEAQRNLSELDTIEDTNIDDTIKDVFADFVKYYKVKQSGEDSFDALKAMMGTIRKMISELFLQGSSPEKELIRDKLSGLF